MSIDKERIIVGSWVVILISLGVVFITHSHREQPLAAPVLLGASPVTQEIQGKTSSEKSKIKGQRIANLHSVAKQNRSKYGIEIVDMNPIDKGVEVFARVWDANGQIGFGEDGSVDIERFIIVNPPILVPDPNGEIVRTWTDDGVQYTKKYREDLQEATLQVIETTLDVKKLKFDSSNIVQGKIGNTTTTIYPAAGTGGTTVDGAASQSGTDASWATLQGGAGSEAADTDTVIRIANIQSDVASAWKAIGRGFFTYDTSVIPDTDTLNSATASFYGTLINDEFSFGDALDVNVYSASLASAGAVVAGDFDSAGSTAFSTTIAKSGFSTAAYNNFALNASGLAAINVTGITEFSTRNVTYDALNVEPTWSSDKNASLRISSADETGTTQDPKLVIEHTAVVSDTCTAPTTGSVWDINMADRCYITTEQYFKGTVACWGTGDLTIASGGSIKANSMYQNTCNPNIIGTGFLFISPNL